jgi:hypothetical protein
MTKPKNVSRYLRRQEADLRYLQDTCRKANRAALAPSDEEGQRRILNDLLSRLGIKGRVGLTEKPLDVVTRMRAAAANEDHARDLDACLHWLAQPTWAVQ